MPQHDYHHLLQIATEAAVGAGELIHGRVETEIAISRKPGGNYDLVTEMDLAAEALTQRIIRDTFPDALFLAEESGGNHDLEHLTWVIDPIDGTVNYAHGIPVYCVSVAAVIGNEPVAGAIFNPATNELFTGIKGGGSFLNGRRLQVSNTSDLRSSVLATGFPYNVEENPYNCIGTFTSIIKMGVPIRRLGSAAIDLAYVAAGRLEGFWEVNLKEWDVAAGILLVLEAGGRVGTYSQDTPSGTLITHRLLATNGSIHDELEGMLRN